MTNPVEISTSRVNWQHFLFCLGLALLVCHELDAVARHKWRLLPGLSLLQDRIALNVFVLMHAPVFAALFWLISHQSPTIRRRSQLGVDMFLIVHAALHAAMSGHARYEFEMPLELVLVYGSAVAGALHAASLLSRREP